MAPDGSIIRTRSESGSSSLVNNPQTHDPFIETTSYSSSIIHEHIIMNASEIVREAHNLAFVDRNGSAAAMLYRQLKGSTVELLYQSAAALFFTYFPSTRSDILLGERLSTNILMETSMSTSEVLAGNVIRTIASQIASTATAALGRPKMALMYFGWPFDSKISFRDRWLDVWLDQTVSIDQRYCKRWVDKQDRNILSTKTHPKVWAEKHVIPRWIVSKLRTKLIDEDHYFHNYDGGLKSFWIDKRAEEKTWVSLSPLTTLHGLMNVVGHLLLDQLNRDLRERLHGFEWWVHRRPWHSNNIMYNTATNTSTEQNPIVIPGMRLHLDGDHIQQQRFGKKAGFLQKTTLHTALVYLSPAVGSPTMLVDKEHGAWFFEGHNSGEVLHFDGSSLWHGALPALGTTNHAADHRIVAAFGFWEEPCIEHGSTCVRYQGEEMAGEGLEEMAGEEDQEKFSIQRLKSSNDAHRPVQSCSPLFLPF
jgi:hypothetical protein